MWVVRLAKTICSKKIILSELQLLMSLLYSEVILFYYEQTQAFVLRGKDRVDITQ